MAFPLLEGAFRTLVPELHDRVPLTRHTALYPMACYVPFFYMAYLARRPHTHLVRMSLLPVTLSGIICAAYRFVWIEPSLNVYNWGQCLFAAVTIAKSLEYAFHKEGMLKVGEIRPGQMKSKEGMNGHATLSKPRLNNPFYDAFELAHTFRGLQWQFGQGVSIPKDTRPMERTPFLRATFVSFTVHFLIVDILESLIKLFPGVGAATGGSMFYPDLSPIWRYSVSTIIHAMTGTAILAGFGMVYHLLTLFAVGCLNSSPTSWPPVMDTPWLADSMHTFWAKRWHQQLRQTFLVLGGYPGQWLAGNLGMLFGTFIASALFHECAMYSMGRGFDWAVFVFFASQGFVLLLERLWSRVTGRRVGGWPGRLWVYFMMFVAGQPATNAWHRRGLGGGMVIPQFASPTKLLLIPIIRNMLHINQ